MKAPIKKHTPLADAEPTVEREPDAKPRDRGRSVDKSDPTPSLGRRVLFRERRPEEVE